ncbi:lipocalin family protein [Myxococcota bacterium]|nr:lipocalin family protein [Myxococcota bacterium]
MNLFRLVPALAVLAAGCSRAEPVPYVDLERYDGLWYEVARYTHSWEEGCTGSTAEYTPMDDGTLEVRNRCFQDSLDGELVEEIGRAEVVDPTSNSRLKVQFDGSPKADYWVIDLDPGTEGDYRWAVVGSPLKAFLWILAREPHLDDETLDGILGRLESLDYDLKALHWTVQPEE